MKYCDFRCYIEILKLVEQGRQLTILDSVDDVSGLLGHQALQNFNQMIFFLPPLISFRQSRAIDALTKQFSGQVVLLNALKK